MIKIIMTNTTTLMLKMNIQKPKTFYFDPPLLNVKGIQFCEMWISPGSYLIYSDIVDSNFSLSNFNDFSEKLTVSNLIGMYPKGLNTIFKTNKSIISKLGITLKKKDLTEPDDNSSILNLNIYHD